MTETGFRGRVAVVTGGTRGIGQSVVEQLADQGAVVAAFYAHSDDRADQLTARYRARRWPITLIKVAVEDAVAVAEGVLAVERQLGPIRYLVNNAGVVRDNWAALMTDEEWKAVFQVNFYGTVVCAQAIIPGMVKRGTGSVVNVVSVSGLHGRAHQANYSAAKGAVIGLTRLLAKRYGPGGVQINAVAPGLVAPDMMAETPAKAQRALLEGTHLGRPGTAEEVARLIIAGLSPSAGYSSGSVFVADGGWLSEMQ